MELEKIWEKTLDILKDKTAKITFNTYIDIIEPVLVGEDTICFLFPSSYHIEVCKQRYLTLIDEALTSASGKQFKYSFATREQYVALEDDPWMQALAIIKSKVSKTAYSTYFENMKAKFLEDNTVCIFCSGEYQVDICIEKYQRTIKNALKEITDKEYTIYFDSEPDANDSDSEIWKKVLQKSKKEISKIAYKTYFEIIMPKFIGEDVVTLVFPSQYHMDIFTIRYMDLFKTNLQEVTKKEYKILLAEEE